MWVCARNISRAVNRKKLKFSLCVIRIGKGCDSNNLDQGVLLYDMRSLAVHRTTASYLDYVMQSF